MSDKHQQPLPPKKKPQGGQAKGFRKSGVHIPKLRTNASLLAASTARNLKAVA